MARHRKDNRRRILCVCCFTGVVIISLLVVVIVLAVKKPEDCPKETQVQPNMQVKEEDYGEVEGKAVKRYTLKNKNDVEVDIINYGGIVTKVSVPDRQGALEDVVLGYDNLEGYINDSAYMGALVGRYANRIANGTFSINGTTYQLAKNNPPNALHGGLKGFNRRVWTASVTDDKLLLKYVSDDGEEGYSGEVAVSVTYQLTDSNELIIDYSATTTKSTVINLTNHAYFNLKGQGVGDILDHNAWISAESYLSADSTNIPTGEVPVAGTPMDFREMKKIGENIAAAGTSGYDHNFCFGKTGWVKTMARIEERSTGRYLEVYSTEPGLQFYTGHYLDATGKGGVKYKAYDGFCLEAQHYPDSPNQLSFPTVVLSPGDTYRQTTTYKFGVIDGQK